MIFTEQHEQLRHTVRTLVEREINPHVDRWEEDEIFPAHELFPKLGRAGLLGANKPVEYGGMGLDYSYALVLAEELGNILVRWQRRIERVLTFLAVLEMARLGWIDLDQRAHLGPVTVVAKVASDIDLNQLTSWVGKRDGPPEDPE